MPLPKRHPQCPSPTGLRTGNIGFTLVEMLVVIMIIVLLAVLMIPAINRIVGSANSIKCVSNLKQIGTGITLYVADYGHLPGPESGAQYAMYPALVPGNGRLAMQLQGYISPDVPVGGGNMVSPTFVCPGFTRLIKLDTSAQPYVMNAGVTINGFHVWGTGAGSTNSTTGAPIASIISPTQPLSGIWVLQDLDKDLTANFGTAPLHPVHPIYNAVQHGADTNSIMQAHPGCYRNALFLDFHVGRMQLDGVTPM